MKNSLFFCFSKNIYFLMKYKYLYYFFVNVLPYKRIL